MSQKIKPLSYIHTGVAVAPGSIMTVPSGSHGSTGQLIPRTTGTLVDPSDAAVNVATMVSAFNNLVWDLGGQGLVQTTPRLWFGDAGTYGVQFIVSGSGVSGGTYKPYPVVQNTLALADVIDAINTAMGGTDNIKLIYSNGRVSLIVKAEYSVDFVDLAPTGEYGVALRIMRRLLPDVPGGLLSSYTGPAYIQGAVLPGPIAGLYPVPAAPGLLSATEITDTSMRLSWIIPQQPPGIIGLRFYVFQDGAYVATVTGGIATYMLTGLTAGQTYTMLVMAATDYEVSVNNPEAIVQTTVPIPSLTSVRTETYYTSSKLIWSPADPDYQIQIAAVPETQITNAISQGTVFASPIYNGSAGSGSTILSNLPLDILYIESRLQKNNIYGDRFYNGPLIQTVSQPVNSFGPIPDYYNGLGDGELPMIAGTNNAGFRFEILGTSNWIGKQFNTIRFPLIKTSFNSGSTGVFTTSYPTTALSVAISNGNSDPYAQAVAYIQPDGNTWSNAYEFGLTDTTLSYAPITVTITNNTRITLVSFINGGNSRFRTSNISIPGVSYSVYSTTTNTFTPVSYSICCEFDLV